MMQRVTTSMTTAAAQRNLQLGASRLAEAQERAASLDKISRPSDDPTATGEALRVRNLQAANAQYQRNLDDGASWLDTVDSTLSSAHDLMAKVRDLTVQGGNGALGPDARDALAREVEGLRADLLQTANARFAGRSIFAGTSDSPAAFAADGTWSGVDGASVTRRIGPDTTVRVDADGASAFGTGTDSAFRLLDDLAADLRSGAPVTGRLTEIDARMSDLRAVQGDVGARHAQILRSKETLIDTSTRLEGRRAEIEDLDLAAAVLDLKLQETSYQSALAVTAKVLQPTLMDFLR